MSARLDVWEAKSPRAWLEDDESWDAAVSCSDAYQLIVGNLDAAYRELDTLEADPYVVEVYVYFGNEQKSLRAFRRDRKSGELVLV